MNGHDRSVAPADTRKLVVWIRIHQGFRRPGRSWPRKLARITKQRRCFSAFFCGHPPGFRTSRPVVPLTSALCPLILGLVAAPLRPQSLEELGRGAGWRNFKTIHHHVRHDSTADGGAIGAKGFIRDQGSDVRAQGRGRRRSRFQA